MKKLWLLVLMCLMLSGCFIQVMINVGKLDNHVNDQDDPFITDNTATADVGALP